MKNSCLASLVAFMLMIFLSVFLLAGQAKILSKPEFLAETVKKSQIITKISESIDALALEQGQKGEQDLNVTALTKLIVQSIDPTMLATEVDQVIVPFLNYLEGKSNTLDAKLDLTAWKQDFTKDWPTVAPPVFRAEYEKLPACQPNEKPNKVQDGQVAITCKSPDLSADTIEQSAKSADLSSFLKMVPDQYDLSDLVKTNQPVFDKIRMGFNVLNMVFWLSLALTVICAAGLVALGWPNWRAISGWLGWIFVAVAAPFLAALLLQDKLMQTMQTTLLANLDQNVSQLVSSIISAFNQASAPAVIWLSATVFVLGLVLVVLSFILPKYEAKITPPGFTPVKRA